MGEREEEEEEEEEEGLFKADAVRGGWSLGGARAEVGRGNEKQQHVRALHQALGV